VSRRITRLTVLSVALVTACTTDFTAYHLESSAASAGADSVGGALGAASSAATNGGVSGHDTVTTGGGTTSTNGGVSSAAGTNNASGTSGTTGGAAGSADGDSPTLPPSCIGLASSCGSDRSASCCDASSVPGGPYNRSDEATAPATVSTFALDDYEVTVGRFRNFVAVYSPTLTAAGAGKNPSNLALDPGWNSAWNTVLPASAAALTTALQCPSGTFTPSAGANESDPVTCVSWFEAYAFCIWDDGRLPTEAEWNYAAAGGAEERVYPWGSTVPDDSYAVFCPGSCDKVQSVGSKAPTGNGKFGQADLVGNAWEWNLDVYANYSSGACNDCANTTATSSSQRVFRGGSAGNDDTFLLSANRYGRDPSDHNGFIGFRCARKP
jgi:sulfatase modifying factor 1